MQPETLVITFDPPLENKAKDKIHEITLREPTAGEWKTWDKLSGVEADIAAISKVSGQPTFVVEQMPASKMVEASRYIGGFIQIALPTGRSE